MMGEEIIIEPFGQRLDGNYYNGLDVSGFSQMLKDPSYCYKFYWLEAIVKLISRDIKQTTFNDIIDEMICNAWYTVLEFHVHLSGMMQGEARDGLERAVLILKEKSDIRSDASTEQIKKEIRKYEVDLKPYKDQLTKNVPYRALAGFFDNAKESVGWGSIKAIMRYAKELDCVSPLPYLFGESAGLNRELYFNKNWIELIQANTVSILGWIQYEKIKWLQSMNPEVPSLVYKLAPMDEKMRKLNHVRDLWECILEQRQIIDVFTDNPIEKRKYDIDHFIPWSFVMNDELWNLMPMDSSLNSSKSNRLPKWDTYFGKYANNQFVLYGMINDDNKPQIHKKFESCYKDNLHSIWGGELYKKGKSQEEFCNMLRKNMEPVYDSAMRQGYQVW